MDESKEALERAAEEHGFGRCKLEGLRIDVKIGVVGNCARASVALRDDTKGAEAKVWMVDEEPGW